MIVIQWHARGEDHETAANTTGAAVRLMDLLNHDDGVQPVGWSASTADETTLMKVEIGLNPAMSPWIERDWQGAVRGESDTTR